MTEHLSEEKLELAISYILIGGVVLSVFFELIGFIGYYFANGSLSVVFQPAFALKGADFFSYAGATVLRLLRGDWTPIDILSLGLVLLMITPYVRVLASTVYFGWVRNMKYLFITLFVLMVLTASLLVH